MIISSFLKVSYRIMIKARIHDKNSGRELSLKGFNLFVSLISLILKRLIKTASKAKGEYLLIKVRSH